MNLAHLLPELRSNSSLKRLVKSISFGSSLAVDDLPLAARPAVIAAMYELARSSRNRGEQSIG